MMKEETTGLERTLEKRGRGAENNPWLQAVEALQKMIDSELIDVFEDENGVPRLVMTQQAYDAFFFSDFMELNDGAKWWDKVVIWLLVMVHRVCSLFGKSEKIQGAIKKYFHKRHWFDEPKALAFLEKVRFLINWRRGYVAGLRNYGQEDLDPKSEEDMLRKLFIPDSEWITFYILGYDNKPIIIGRWIRERFELKRWEE